MKKSVMLIPLVMLLTFAFSCKKEKSKTTLLTSSPWKLTNLVLLDGTDVTEDCHKDNIYTFKTDGTASVNIGTTICDEGTVDEEKNFTINWLFNSNETFFTLDGEVYEVVTLDANSLMLKDAFGTTKFKH